MRIRVTEHVAPAVLVARVEKALGRVLAAMKADDLAKLEKVADAARFGVVLVTIVPAVAPVLSREIAELEEAAVEAADDAGLDAMIAAELAVLVAGKRERPKSMADVAHDVAASLVTRDERPRRGTPGTAGEAVAASLNGETTEERHAGGTPEGVGQSVAGFL